MLSKRDRGATIRDRLARDMSRRVVDQMATARNRRHIWSSLLLVRLLATAVHLTTVALAGVGVWLAAAGDGWPLRAVGICCVVVAIAFVPRAPKAPRDVVFVDRSTAPELLAALAEVAEVVDSPMPEIGFYDGFNAAAGVYRRGRRVLTIGAPLWVSCSWEARIALLGHELGHFANSDGAHGRYVSSAVYAVSSWIDALTPADLLLPHGHNVLPSSVVRVVTWPVRAALFGYVRLLRIADQANHRRQEHYADLGAALAGGTAGAADLLETLLTEVGVEVACNRAAVSGRPLRPEIEAHMASYDAEARQRNRARAAAERVRFDASHPPTTERLRLVESLGAVDPVVLVDADRRDRIDAELEDIIDQQLKRLAVAFRGG